MRRVFNADSGRVDFFRVNAGYSVAPGETEEQGRQRSAVEYAAAEEWLMEQAGHQVEWVADEDADGPGQWGCVVTVGGESAGLWGIDFGDGREPWGQSYARVVVAELALELMGVE